MWCDSICTQLIETFSDMTSSFHVTKTETKKRNKFCAICFIQVTMTVWEWMAESYFACLSLSPPPPRARLFLSTYLSVLVVGGRGFKDKIHAVSASVCLCLRETGACGQSCLRKCEHVTKCLPVLFTLIPNQFNKASVKPICLPKSSHTTLRSQRWSSNETLF